MSISPISQRRTLHGMNSAPLPGLIGVEGKESAGVDTAASFLSKLMQDGNLNQDQVINLLIMGHPNDINQYSEHIFKLLSLLHEGHLLLQENTSRLSEKLFTLFDYLPAYESVNNPLQSQLYLIIEKNFDMLIKVSVDEFSMELSTKSIRFLTKVMMLLNYWEIYNLLSWKPAIYHFLAVIHFDLNECYMKFIKDYATYNYQQAHIVFNTENIGKRHSRILDDYVNEDDESDDSDRRNSEVSESSGMDTPSNRNSISDSTSPSYYYTNDDANEGSLVVQQVGDGTLIINSEGQRVAGHRVDGFINNDVKSLAARERKRITIEPKLARKIIKRANTRISAKSSNYDPDVVHECQLSSADEPGKMCLRRFSRKYELIRHQETVHSKKKKLFKCFVCVKQNPGIGPRIFTRHDTLAKHIRVNHKISGKDAKAEVAFSKRHAEVVEEGDITVHVGRRKTKVDFELRAHMEKKRTGDDDLDYSDGEADDTNNSIMDEDDDDMEVNDDISLTPEAPQMNSLVYDSPSAERSEKSDPREPIEIVDRIDDADMMGNDDRNDAIQIILSRESTGAASQRNDNIEASQRNNTIEPVSVVPIPQQQIQTIDMIEGGARNEGTDKMEKSTIKEKSEKPARTDKAEKTPRTEKIEKPKAERKRTNKSEKMTRTFRPEKDKIERHGRNSLSHTQPAPIKVSKQTPTDTSPYYPTEQIMNISTWNLARPKIRFHQEQPGLPPAKSLQLPTIKLPSIQSDNDIKHLTPKSSFLTNNNKNNS